MLAQFDGTVDQAEGNKIWVELTQKKEMLNKLVKFQISLYQLIRWIQISAGTLEPDPKRGENLRREGKLRLTAPQPRSTADEDA